MPKHEDDDAARRLAEMQLPLFTDADLAAARDADIADGMARALGAKPEWVDVAYGAIIRLARTGVPFTSEDVTDLVGLPSGTPGQHKNNAVGALMALASKDGIIRKTGRTPQMKTRRNHGAFNEWVGTRYVEPE